MDKLIISSVLQHIFRKLSYTQTALLSENNDHLFIGQNLKSYLPLKFIQPEIRNFFHILNTGLWPSRRENDTYPDFVSRVYYACDMLLLIDIVIKSWCGDKGNCTFIISNWHMWVSKWLFYIWSTESPAGGSECD